MPIGQGPKAARASGFPGNSALAAAHETGELICQGMGKCIELPASFFLLERTAIEGKVATFYDSNFLVCEARAAKTNEVDTFHGNIKFRVEKEGGQIGIHTRVAADHGEPADLRELVNNHAAGDESLVFDFDIAGQQGAACDNDMAAKLAIVSNVTGSHDEIVISNYGRRFGFGGAGNCEVFTDLVVAADAEIAALTLEVLVERIGAEHDGGTDFIGVSESGPAFDVDMGIEDTVAAKLYVLLDDAVFADHTTGANYRFGVNSGGGGHTRPRVYGHK